MKFQIKQCQGLSQVLFISYTKRIILCSFIFIFCIINLHTCISKKVHYLLYLLCLKINEKSQGVNTIHFCFCIFLFICDIFTIKWVKATFLVHLSLPLRQKKILLSQNFFVIIQTSILIVVNMETVKVAISSKKQRQHKNSVTERTAKFTGLFLHYINFNYENASLKEKRTTKRTITHKKTF